MSDPVEESVAPPSGIEIHEENDGKQNTADDYVTLTDFNRVTGALQTALDELKKVVENGISSASQSTTAIQSGQLPPFGTEDEPDPIGDPWYLRRL